MLPLPAPRPLGEEERELVDFLLAGPLGNEELRLQARTARVVSHCSCGCRSVGLSVEGPGIAAPGTRSWLGLAATDQSASGGRIEVTLHVVDGALDRLEVWGGRYGARPPLDIGRFQHAQID
jgi:hypothetical protein